MTTTPTETPGDILRDWHARNYLDYYYGHPDVPDDEAAMFAFIARGLRDIGTRFEAALELGCGPVLHHVAQLAPWADRLDMADYQESNLEEIRRWLRRDPDAFDWSIFINGTRGVLDAEDRAFGGLAEREAAMRSRIQLMRCDLRSDQPLAKSAQYPLVMCCYCSEWVEPSVVGWRTTMVRIASLVAPRGWLFLLGVYETEFCIINERRMQCARLTEHELRSTLTAVGFDTSTLQFSATPGLRPEESGIQGTFMLYVQRAGAATGKPA